MEYDNTNQGALFVNDKKQSEQHPDFKGSIDVGGREFWISAWKNMSKTGKPFIKLSVEPKEQRSDSRDDVPPPQSEDDYGSNPFDM